MPDKNSVNKLSSEILQRARRQDIALDGFARYQLPPLHSDGLLFGYGCCEANDLETAVKKLAAIFHSPKNNTHP